METHLEQAGADRLARGGPSCPGAASSSPSMPSRRGTEKPQMSASSSPTVRPAPGQGHGQVDRDRRLAHAALARGDGQHPGRGRDGGRRRASSWACQPGPVHDRARWPGVHLARCATSTAVTPGSAPTRPLDVALDLGPQRAAGDGQGDLHLRPAPSGRRSTSPHHAEVDDVVAELGVDDRPQRLTHVLGLGRCEIGLGGRHPLARSGRPGGHARDATCGICRARRVVGRGRVPADADAGTMGARSRRTRNKEASVTTMATRSASARSPSPVTLTDAAAAKVAELLAQEDSDELALRVAVRPGAARATATRCSSTPRWPTTTSSASSARCKVVVDPASAELLKGATLDYSDGLQGAGFHITNPNATRTCGCGSSFS